MQIKQKHMNEYKCHLTVLKKWKKSWIFSLNLDTFKKCHTLALSVLTVGLVDYA